MYPLTNKKPLQKLKDMFYVDHSFGVSEAVHNRMQLSGAFE